MWQEVRRYTPATARRLVEAAGLRPERVSFLFASLFPLMASIRLVQRVTRRFGRTRARGHRHRGARRADESAVDGVGERRGGARQARADADRQLAVGGCEKDVERTLQRATGIDRSSMVRTEPALRSTSPSTPDRRHPRRGDSRRSVSDIRAVRRRDYRSSPSRTDRGRRPSRRRRCRSASVIFLARKPGTLKPVNSAVNEKVLCG